MTEIEVDVKIIYPLNFQFLEMESGNAFTEQAKDRTNSVSPRRIFSFSVL